MGGINQELGMNIHSLLYIRYTRYIYLYIYIYIYIYIYTLNIANTVYKTYNQ